MPSGGIGPGVFLHHRQSLGIKSLWKYNSIFQKMFLLIPGLVLMSYVCKTTSSKALFSYWWNLDGEICFLSGTCQCKLHGEHCYITLINKVHINEIYILALYSGYFGKNIGILGSRIIKMCANIKLNRVVYKIAKWICLSVLFYLST